MKKSLYGAALVGALLCTRGPARSEVAEGDMPGDYVAKEFVNTAPCTFKSLRGHAVLVEIFQTW